MHANVIIRCCDTRQIKAGVCIKFDIKSHKNLMSLSQILIMR